MSQTPGGSPQCWRSSKTALHFGLASSSNPIMSRFSFQPARWSSCPIAIPPYPPIGPFCPIVVPTLTTSYDLYANPYDLCPNQPLMNDYASVSYERLATSRCRTNASVSVSY